MRFHWHILLLLVILAAISGGVYALWLNDTDVVLENHLVEWSQVVFLLLAAVIHIGRGAIERPEWHGAGHLRIGLALLCISMAMREVDIHTLHVDERMETLETVLRLILVGIWVGFAWCVRRVWVQWWRHKWRIVMSGVGMLTFAGCALYAASWPFDKYPEHFGGEMAMLFEETVQLNGTIMFFVASCCRFGQRNQSSPSGSADRQ